MVSNFKEKGSYGIIWIVILSIILHFSAIAQTPIYPIKTPVYILDKIVVAMMQMPSIAIFLIYQLIIIIQAIRLNIVMNNADMLDKSDTTIGMTYIILSALIPQWQYISPALILNFALIFSIAFFKKIFNSNHPENIIFSISLFFSVAALLYPPFILFILFAYTVIFASKNINLRQFLLSILALVLPYYFLGGTLYLTDHILAYKSFLPQFQWNPFAKKQPQAFMFGWMYTLILTIMGIYYLSGNNNKITLAGRKIWSKLFVWILLTIVLMLFFSTKNNQLCDTALLISPLAALVANSFHYEKKKWICRVFFWLSILVAITLNWSTLLGFLR